MSELQKGVGRAYSTAFEDHKPLIQKLARKGYLRLMGAHVSVDYEDVFQEMCVTYTKAATRYNPEVGVTFTAYLGRAIWNDFNQFAEREVNQKIHCSPFSIEGLSAHSSEEGIDLYDVLPGNSPTPEQLLEAKQRNSMVRNKKAKRFCRELMETVTRPGDDDEKPTFTSIVKKAGLSQNDRKIVKAQIYEIYGIKLGLPNHGF